MNYISTSEAGVKWGLSRRRVAILCKGNRVLGAQRSGETWIIPEDAKKPDDARIKSGKYIKKNTDGASRDSIGKRYQMIDLLQALSAKEKASLEVKLAQGGLPNSLWATYSSFANTAGGVILLGIKETDKGLSVAGVEDADKMIKEIWNTLNNTQKISTNILYENHVYDLNYEGKTIIVIEVPRADRRDKPVYVGSDMFKGSYRRNGDGDYHCAPGEVKAMLRDQADTSPDALLLDKLELDVLDSESVRRYRIMFDNIKPNHVWSKLSTEEFLVKIGAAMKSTEDKKVHPTLGGLIFFGEFINIINELPAYFLDYREHMVKGTRWSDRVSSGDGDWSGNVFDFYFKVIDRLTADVKTPFALKDGLTRVDETPVHTAMREALANALIHADYYGAQGIVINKEFRKVTISNPGTFRIGIDVAIAGGISDARNSRIFNMFSLINVGERSGTGLCDLFHVWKENGFKSPEITETVNPDRVTLTLHIEGASNYGNKYNRDNNPNRRGTNYERNGYLHDSVWNNRDSNHDSNDSNRDNNDSNHDSNDNNLTVTEYLIFKAILADAEVTAEQIAKMLSISLSTVNRTFKILKAKKYIKREGSTRGKWIVLKRGKASD